MTKKDEKILFWILVCAALVVVGIYSPIGRPDLYAPNNYIIYIQSANFSGGIANSPKKRNYRQNESIDLGLPKLTQASENYSAQTLNTQTFGSPTSYLGTFQPNSYNKASNQYNSSFGSGTAILGTRRSNALV